MNYEKLIGKILWRRERALIGKVVQELGQKPE